jgi:hypothetical protein
MDADLDLLCTSVYCTADDLLPQKPPNWRRALTDAEVVTLCVAQVMMGIPSDRRFLRAANRQLGHLFPYLPTQSGLHKRRGRLAGTIEWLVGVFASQSPAATDPVVVIDSTPVECGRSVETTRRSQLADVAGYGYSRSHSGWFWGMRLHLACSLDGTPRAVMLCGADRKERDVALRQSYPSPLAPGPPPPSATRATPATNSRLRPPGWASPSCAPPAATNPTPDPTSHPSANASNPSSRPARTSSAWNATAPAPSKT